MNNITKYEKSLVIELYKYYGMLSDEFFELKTSEEQEEMAKKKKVVMDLIYKLNENDEVRDYFTAYSVGKIREVVQDVEDKIDTEFATKVTENILEFMDKNKDKLKEKYGDMPKDDLIKKLFNEAELDNKGNVKINL